ncbi:MAG: hypothetical protein H0X33_02135 [Taibaiella sp.]|nr:hypothetical protein [Taibaiella sp.]
MIINHWIRITKEEVKKDNAVIHELSASLSTAEDIYKAQGYTYLKFFKMDILSKWAWFSAECLLNCDNQLLYNSLDKNKIGIVLSTSHGCLQADKSFNATLATIPSPAVFVYTLPNIMLGELCIRHGFKGEQFCLENEVFDPEQTHFLVSDLMEKREVDACLCGWVDVTKEEKDICLFWITKDSKGKEFSPAAMQEIYNN